MRVVMITMPWHALDTPSLALGVLRAKAQEQCPQHELIDYYGNIGWAEFLLERTQGAIKPTVYRDISENGFLDALGEWMFSGALYGRPSWRVRAYSRYLNEKGVDAEPAIVIQELAPEYIEIALREVRDLSPDVVGFTSTFMQNVPSLALARRLKEESPDLSVIFGGGNCDGSQGPALHRNFPFVDYVVSGEGERSFPALLDAIDAGDGFEEVPGLSWRRNGTTVTNEAVGDPVSVDEIAVPDFVSYFDRVEGSTVRPYVEPKLVMETSRGCWWGEKHHCTFCGLNGSLMKFRAKSATAAFDELSYLVGKHKCLDIIMVDNILAMPYFSDFLPAVVAADWDLRIHYEVKANLNSEQVSLLRQAGVAHVQPGIESLSSDVLRLMKKGVQGTQNVELLRICDENNLTVSWNILYGFPGETNIQYDKIGSQLPALVHLQPPGGAARIALERFSPNFNFAQEWFGDVRPARVFRYVYDLDEQDLEDMVYLYDAPPAGLVGTAEEHFSDAVTHWIDNHAGSALTYESNGDGLTIADERAGWSQQAFRIESDAKAAAYLSLRSHTTVDGLRRRLLDDGFDTGIDELSGWLEEWLELGLVFEDDGRFVALATRREARPVNV